MRVVPAFKKLPLFWFPFQMDSSIPSCLESPGYSETTLMKIVNKINLSVFTKHIHILNEEITYAHMEIALTTSLPQAGCLTLDQEEFRGKKSFLVTKSLTFLQGVFLFPPLFLWQELRAHSCVFQAISPKLLDRTHQQLHTILDTQHSQPAVQTSSTLSADVT